MCVHLAGWVLEKKNKLPRSIARQLDLFSMERKKIKEEKYIWQYYFNRIFYNLVDISSLQHLVKTKSKIITNTNLVVLQIPCMVSGNTYSWCSYRFAPWAKGMCRCVFLRCDLWFLFLMELLYKCLVMRLLIFFKLNFVKYLLAFFSFGFVRICSWCDCFPPVGMSDTCRF